MGGEPPEPSAEIRLVHWIIGVYDVDFQLEGPELVVQFVWRDIENDGLVWSGRGLFREDDVAFPILDGLGDVERRLGIKVRRNDGVLDGDGFFRIEEGAETAWFDLKRYARHVFLCGCGGYVEISKFERADGVRLVDFDSDDDFRDGPVDFGFARPPRIRELRKIDGKLLPLAGGAEFRNAAHLLPPLAVHAADEQARVRDGGAGHEGERRRPLRQMAILDESDVVAFGEIEADFRRNRLSLREFQRSLRAGEFAAEREAACWLDDEPPWLRGGDRQRGQHDECEQLFHGDAFLWV